MQAFAAVLLFLASTVPARAQIDCETARCALQSAVDQRCPCTEAATRGEYVRCVATVVRELVGDGTIPLACKREVKRCATRAICGRPPGAVVCDIPKLSGTRSAPAAIIRRLDPLHDSCSSDADCVLEPLQDQLRGRQHHGGARSRPPELLRSAHLLRDALRRSHVQRGRDLRDLRALGPGGQRSCHLSPPNASRSHLYSVSAACRRRTSVTTATGRRRSFRVLPACSRHRRCGPGRSGGVNRWSPAAPGANIAGRWDGKVATDSADGHVASAGVPLPPAASCTWPPEETISAAGAAREAPGPARADPDPWRHRRAQYHIDVRRARAVTLSASNVSHGCPSI
jgi:hypothetical protein